MEQIKELVDKEVPNGWTSYYGAAVDKLTGLLPGYLEDMEAGAEAAREKLKEAVTDAQKEREQTKINNWQKRKEQARAEVEDIKATLAALKPGVPLELTTTEENAAVTVYATPIGFSLKDLKANPTARGSIKVRFAIADASRQIDVPLSKLVEGGAFSYKQASAKTVTEAFENGQTASRERRFMITGNLLAGIELFKGGQVTMFTDDEGNTRPGVLMPKVFDPYAELAARPVEFADPAHAVAFLDDGPSNGRVVKDESGALSISRDGGTYQLVVSRQGGKPFFLNPAVRKIVGDFEGRKKSMVARVFKPAELKKVIATYQEHLGTVFSTQTDKDAAREITGEQEIRARCRGNAWGAGNEAQRPEGERPPGGSPRRLGGGRKFATRRFAEGDARRAGGNASSRP